jgi:hypothetical protein
MSRKAKSTFSQIAKKRWAKLKGTGKNTLQVFVPVSLPTPTSLLTASSLWCKAGYVNKKMLCDPQG